MATNGNDSTTQKQNQNQNDPEPQPPPQSLTHLEPEIFETITDTTPSNPEDVSKLTNTATSLPPPPPYSQSLTSTSPSPSPSALQLEISLKLVNHDNPELHNVSISSHSTLSDLNEQVASTFNLPVTNQILVHNGQKLEGSEKTLQALHIQNQATVCVIDTQWTPAAQAHDASGDEEKPEAAAAVVIQSAIRGWLSRKHAELPVDLEALQRIADLPAAYTEARMELPMDEIKQQPCDQSDKEPTEAEAEGEAEGGGKEKEEDEVCPQGPLLGDELEGGMGGVEHNVSGLDLDNMGLPAAVENNVDTTRMGDLHVGESEGVDESKIHKGEEVDREDESEDEEVEVESKVVGTGMDGRKKGTKKVVKREEVVAVDVDLEAEFDEDSYCEVEEEEIRLYDRINAASSMVTAAASKPTQSRSEAKSEAETRDNSLGHVSEVSQKGEVGGLESNNRVDKSQRLAAKKRVQYTPKSLPSPLRPPRKKEVRGVHDEAAVVIPQEKDYLSMCGTIDTPRSLYALFRLIHEDVRPYRKSVVSSIPPEFGQRKSPLKPSLTGSNRQLLFGPSLNESNGLFLNDSESTKSSMSSAAQDEASSAAQMEQNLSSMRRRAENAHATKRRRVDYVQRAQYDTAVAKEIAATLLTARQQNKLVLTTPAESIGYWIYTEGWGALLAAFEVDNHNAATQPADSAFMEELRRQIRSKGSVNGELVRQYLNCILRGLAASKELASKVRGIPTQEEIPPSYAWSFGRAVLAFRRVFMSYYSPGLFQQVEGDMELHCKLIQDAMNDLHAFQAQLVSSLVWHFPHLITSNVRDQSGTFGKVVAEAFQHRDSRQGSSFLAASEAKDVVQGCVEDAVINPLMDNLYLFFFPLCHKEDQTIRVFCEALGEIPDTGEIFAQFQESTWTKVMGAATAAIEQGFQQRTFSSKLRSMTEALQILLLHERARANEEVLVSAFFFIVVRSLPFNLSTQCRLLRENFNDRQFNVQTKYCLSLLEMSKLALLQLAKENTRAKVAKDEITLTGV